jgi:hypothetical protein
MGEIEVVDQFSDQLWRLHNLYYIIDDSGREIRFLPNEMQEDFIKNMWYLNVIVKGRQHGFTTLIDIFILDCCVFTPNLTGGIIAHTLDDVKKIFRRKIKHPYDRLPDQIKAVTAPTNDTQNELIFTNKSEISVDTSMRSGTYNYLHVSEYGKISIAYPDKAVEIKTGSFNTVHPGNYIFVESTGHGKGGEFYAVAQASRRLKQLNKRLTMHDFKYHFYPWWANPKYVMSDEDTREVIFTKEYQLYFAKVERVMNTKLSTNQRAWYISKKRWNGDEMKREHPSTDEEPFEAVLKGAYFAEQMQEARESNRITKVPHERGLSVDTWWDLGMRDKMAIWFVQQVGMEVRCIYYHEISDRSLEWHLKLLTQMRIERGYQYRYHIGPHDFAVRDLGTGKSRWELANLMGYTFIIAQKFDRDDQIEAGRNQLATTWFDEENCDVGIAHLEQFRKEWSERMGSYADTWRHDEHSHGASAYMTGACMQGMVSRGRPRARPIQTRRFAT